MAAVPYRYGRIAVDAETGALDCEDTATSIQLYQGTTPVFTVCSTLEDVDDVDVYFQRRRLCRYISGVVLSTTTPHQSGLLLVLPQVLVRHVMP